MSFPSVCALLIVKIGQRNKTAALCGRGKVLKECQFENLYIWPYAANSQKIKQIFDSNISADFEVSH